MKLFPEGGFSVPIGSVKPFNPKSASVTWLIANDPEDMGAHPNRIRRFIEMYESQGSDTYVIPLATELRLSEQEKQEYGTLLSRSATLALGLGGSDLTPQLFEQENRESVDTNLARDKSEAWLWRFFLESRHRPYLMAICRSHQFLLSLLGFPLVQDIEKELKLKSHRKGNHELRVLNSVGFEELYSSLPRGESNTFHHQGFFHISENEFIEITARSSDGMVEATIFKDGSGATFQFHPELMTPEVFLAFARDSLRQAQVYKTSRFLVSSPKPEIGSKSCRRLFSN